MILKSLTAPHLSSEVGCRRDDAERDEVSDGWVLIKAPWSVSNAMVCAYKGAAVFPAKVAQGVRGLCFAVSLLPYISLMIAANGAENRSQSRAGNTGHAELHDPGEHGDAERVRVRNNGERRLSERVHF